MTDQTAGRGEGLAGLVAKWRQSCSVGPRYKEGTVTPVDVREGVLRCADQLETAATRERMHQRAVREKVCNLRGLIEASRNGFLNGQPYILTYTDIISELSEIEAALEAAAPPSTPTGGFVTGFERVLSERDGLKAALTSGLELVENAFAHVSHGGPTRADAERWVAVAREALGERI